MVLTLELMLRWCSFCTWTLDLHHQDVPQVQLWLLEQPSFGSNSKAWMISVLCPTLFDSCEAIKDDIQDIFKILVIHKLQIVTYSILSGKNTFNGSICVTFSHHSSKRFLNLTINFLKITYLSEFVLRQLINLLPSCSFLFTYKDKVRSRMKYPMPSVEGKNTYSCINLRVPTKQIKL
jgi:hypothetical protein